TLTPPFRVTPFTIESISYWAFTIAASRASDLRWVSEESSGSEPPMPIAVMYFPCAGSWLRTVSTTPEWTRDCTAEQPDRKRAPREDAATTARPSSDFLISFIDASVLHDDWLQSNPG